MSTTRTRKAHGRIELNGLVRHHLETGDCLIAGAGKGCHCGLRDADGNERHDLIKQLKARIEKEIVK